MKRTTKILSFIIVASMLLSVCMIPLSALNYRDYIETKTVFFDVPKDAWCYDEVMYSYYYGFTRGTQTYEYECETNYFTFEPERRLTRAEFITMLVRLAFNLQQYELPKSKTYKSKFSDYKNNKWYTESLIWAETYGIANGVSETEFGVNKFITREEIAVLLSRYADSHKLILPEDEDPVESFKDCEKVSSWAKDAVELMRQTGIIKGNETGNFNPKGVATRAEAAALMVRFYENIELDLDEFYNTDVVGKIVFDDFGFFERKTYEVTDPEELEEILKYLREMPIESSQLIQWYGKDYGVGGDVMYIYDKSGRMLQWNDYDESNIEIEDYIVYKVSDGYFQKYVDIFETVE